MSNFDEHIEYKELYELIEKYSRMDWYFQLKALSLIAKNITPFRNLPQKGCRDIVERVFKEHNYLLLDGGRPSLQGIDAIVAVALWGSYDQWGQQMLLNVLQALVDKGKREDHLDATSMNEVLGAIARLPQYSPYAGANSEEDPPIGTADQFNQTSS